MRKNGFNKDLPALPQRDIFHVILLTGNHFGINLQLSVLQKV